MESAIRISLVIIALVHAAVRHPSFELPIMQNPSAKRPDTPCVAVCSTTFDDVCRGCGRTVAEVAQWVFMNEEEKEQVWQRITAQGYPRRNS
jgi:predicted Fe-S protein YdhL (DUF1289 family)